MASAIAAAGAQPAQPGPDAPGAAATPAAAPAAGHSPTSAAASLLLRRAGLKATLPRLRVVAALQALQAQDATGRHVRADALYLHLQQQGAGVSLGTVYRVLAQLVQGGVLRRSQFADGKALHELADEQPHLHLVQQDGGHITELQDAALQQRLAELVAAQGLTIVGQQLVVYVRDAAARPARPALPLDA